MRFKSLPDWLAWLEQQHPKSIDLGLERIAEAAGRLGVVGFDATVITVAGTNGKGSFVTSLAALLRAHGQRVATYTSPHLLVFNERINLDGNPATDEQLLEALNRVDQACQGISLTYFEFTTLAAFYLFRQHPFDFIILEVGLGGRLDAVNIIEPDYAVITSIGLDHQEYLGDTLESIAAEKCGILRNNTPLLCAEPEPPEPLQKAIASHPSRVIGRDFIVEEEGAGWALSVPEFFAGRLQLQANGLSEPSQAAAICCLYQILGEKVEPVRIQKTLDGLSLAGRFQRFEKNRVTIILDVAHNVQAISLLRSRLRQMPLPQGGKRVAVFNMLADKDAESVVGLLHDDFAGWFLGDLDTPRALPVETMADLLHASGQERVSCSKNMRQALARAMSVCQPGDQIVAFGSFYVVSELLPRLNQI